MLLRYRGSEGMLAWAFHRISGVAIWAFILLHVLDIWLVGANPASVLILAWKTNARSTNVACLHLQLLRYSTCLGPLVAPLVEGGR
jgi:succinate dehydrogenase/fumarate reductase cytochrome b subunit